MSQQESVPEQIDLRGFDHWTLLTASTNLIRLLEEALALADDLIDERTGYLIERAIDEARSRQFRLPSAS